LGFVASKREGNTTTYKTVFVLGHPNGSAMMEIEMDGERRVWSYGNAVLQQLKEIEARYGLANVDLEVRREVERRRVRTVVLAVARE
jgi:hypothetical protein